VEGVGTQESPAITRSAFGYGIRFKFRSVGVLTPPPYRHIGDNKCIYIMYPILESYSSN